MSYTKIFIKDNIRIYISDFTLISQIAIQKQNSKPLASLALATSIATFGPLGVMKKETKTSIFYKFNGVLKNILLDTNSDGDIRALIGNPYVETDFDDKNINEIPLKIGIGEQGTLKITYIKNDKTFSGEVKMAKGDITTDLAYYFDQSEQIYTAIISDVKFKNPKTIERSYSAIFQLMPGHKEKDIKWIENFVKNNKISENTIESYISKMNANEIANKKTRWKCKCNEEKMKKILNLIPENEKKEIIQKYGKLEIKCNFCNDIFSI